MSENLDIGKQKPKNPSSSKRQLKLLGLAALSSMLPPLLEVLQDWMIRKSRISEFPDPTSVDDQNRL